MKIKCNYIDNSIVFEDGKINAIELESKRFFYRFVSNLYSISNGDILEEFICLDGNNKEINLANRVKIFNNYFEFDFNSKKYNNEIIKQLIDNINDEDKNDIVIFQRKLYQKINRQLNRFDIPLFISNDLDIETILKGVKILVNSFDGILNNLFLLIDIEKTLNLSSILVFINLKQYLSNEELEELYKYSIYNDVKILLVDSQCYSNKSIYENKLFIDKDLVEFVL